MLFGHPEISILTVVILSLALLAAMGHSKGARAIRSAVRILGSMVVGAFCMGYSFVRTRESLLVVVRERFTHRQRRRIDDSCNSLRLFPKTRQLNAQYFPLEDWVLRVSAGQTRNPAAQFQSRAAA
ncbi:MAG: hypothetical protein HOL01_17285 [Planctomycetaceae bacterium]|jgi:hypothetical protein|nr:hypothetical protein [Planctomycetaceae bacterium]MBT6483996.1 hypothetical protein [Planctomycetaceae bacterium]MBT6496301.1 hypothetical protein [Planctomycetaceae bacterium]